MEEGSGVSLKFLLPAGCDELSVTQALHEAWERCSEAGLSLSWLEEETMLKLKSPLSKEVVFVADPFSGAGFDHLSTLTTSIIGPRLLLFCLATGREVPNLPYPLFTATMLGISVTFTGLEGTHLTRLEGLVRQMSGTVSKDYHDGVTHIVAAKVGSPKCRVAISHDVPIMRPAWVDQVWKQGSLNSMLKATDARFATLRCSTLYGLNVAVTGLSREERLEVKRLLEDQGATYSASLELDDTSLLLCSSDSSDKYKKAMQWGVPCLATRWLRESIKAKTCLPFTDFRFEAEEEVAEDSFDQTRDGTFEEKSNMEEMPPTEPKMPELGQLVNQESPSQELTHFKEDEEGNILLAKLDLKNVKAAGTFLDGCKIVLFGFTENQNVHLARVLKFAGAVRLSQIVEGVTQVVAAEKDSGSLLNMNPLCPSPPIVDLQWLVNSMEKGEPAPLDDDPDPCQSAEETQEDKKIEELCNEEEEGGFEEKLLAQYAAMGVPQNRTAFW